MARTTRAHPSPSGLKSLSTPKREGRDKKEKAQPVTKTTKQKTAVASTIKKVAAPKPSPPTATSQSDVESDSAAAPESRSTSPPLAITRRITRSQSRSFSPINDLASGVASTAKRVIAAVKTKTSRTANAAAPLMSKPAAKPRGKKLQKPIRNKTSKQTISSTESAEEVENPRPQGLKRTRSNRSIGSPAADNESRPIKRTRQAESQQTQPQQHIEEPVVADNDYDVDSPAVYTPAHASTSQSVNPITSTIEAEHDEVMSSEVEDEATIIKNESRPSTSGSIEVFRPPFSAFDMADLSFRSSSESTPRSLSASAPPQFMQPSTYAAVQAIGQADSIPTSEQEAATPSMLNRSINLSRPHSTPAAQSQHGSPAAKELSVETSVVDEVSSPFLTLPLNSPVADNSEMQSPLHQDSSLFDISQPDLPLHQHSSPIHRRSSTRSFDIPTTVAGMAECLSRKPHDFRRSTSEQQAKLFGIIAVDTEMDVDSATGRQSTKSPQTPQTPSRSPGTGMWGRLSKVKDAVLSPFKFIGLGNQTTSESPTPSKKAAAPEFTFTQPHNLPHPSDVTPTKKPVRTIAPRTRKLPKPPGGEKPPVQRIHSFSKTKAPERLRLRHTPEQLATRHMGEITEERRQKSLEEQRIRAAREAEARAVAEAARAAEEAANSQNSLQSPVRSTHRSRATCAVAPDLSAIQELEESSLSVRREQRNAYAATVEDDNDADNENPNNMTLSQANQQVGGKRKRTYTAMSRPGTYAQPDSIMSDADSDESTLISGYDNSVSMTLESPVHNSPASKWKGRQVYTPWGQPYKNDDTVNPYADRLVYEYTPPNVPIFWKKKPAIMISQNFHVAQQHPGDYWRQLWEIQRVMTPEQRYHDDFERKHGYGSCEAWLRLHHLHEDENGNFQEFGLGRDYYELMRFTEFPEMIPPGGHRVLNPPEPEYDAPTSPGRTFKCPSPDSDSSDESDDGSDNESELPKLAPEAPRPVHAELPAPQTPLAQLSGNIQKYAPSVSSNLRFVKNSSPLQLAHVADPASPLYLFADRIEFSKLSFEGISLEVMEAIKRAPSPDFDGIKF